jgi:hypothetical protein
MLDASGSFDARFRHVGACSSPRRISRHRHRGIERLRPAAKAARCRRSYQLAGSGAASTRAGRVGADGAMDATFGDAGRLPARLAGGNVDELSTGFLRQTDGSSSPRRIPRIELLAPHRRRRRARPRASATAASPRRHGAHGVFRRPRSRSRDGRVIVAGMVERSPPLYELAVLRLGEAVQDKIFVNGFDGAR